MCDPLQNAHSTFDFKVHQDIPAEYDIEQTADIPVRIDQVQLLKCYQAPHRGRDLSSLRFTIKLEESLASFVLKCANGCFRIFAPLAAGQGLRVQIRG